jgi:hypothetical protein
VVSKDIDFSRLLLPPAVAATEEIVSHDLDAVLVRLLKGAVVTEQAHPDRVPFDSFDAVGSFADLKYAKWMLFEFADRNKGDDLLAVLRERECEMYGVNVYTQADGREVCTALCGRKYVRRKFSPADR